MKDHREILLAAIQASGLKKKWIAKKIGVDPATMSRWLAGRTPKVESAVALCDLIGAEVREAFPELAEK